MKTFKELFNKNSNISTRFNSCQNQFLRTLNNILHVNDIVKQDNRMLEEYNRLYKDYEKLGDLHLHMSMDINNLRNEYTARYNTLKESSSEFIEDYEKLTSDIMEELNRMHERTIKRLMTDDDEQ